MTIVERPNQEALSRAINIYLDAIRPFVTRNLKGVSSRSVKEAILQSLPPDKAEYIVQNLPENVDPESTIEVSHVDFILSHYWKEAFAPLFRNCDVIFVKIRCATSARNQVSHPAYRRDLDEIETLEYLDALVYLLCAIGASEESEAVANIRAELENPGGQKKKAKEGFDRLEDQYEKLWMRLKKLERFCGKLNPISKRRVRNWSGQSPPDKKRRRTRKLLRSYFARRSNYWKRKSLAEAGPRNWLRRRPERVRLTNKQISKGEESSIKQFETLELQ